jgi:hypothetical protein
MYKILDRDLNEHVTFDTYAEACIFKGVKPSAAYKVKRNTKDRPKDFKSHPLITLAEAGLINSYINAWLSLNHLKGA